MSRRSRRYQQQIEGLLGGICGEAAGDYACVLEPAGLVAEFVAGDESAERLADALVDRTAAIFALPQAMAGDGPAEDAFAGLEGHGFLVAVVNGKFALVVACLDPEGARGPVERPFRALVDRLFRIEPKWRIDGEGRGFLFGRAKVDWIVVGATGAAT